ncbi:acyl-[ACP]--phospholipid O-acyltransferase [Sedimenticola hydrogenitrophicus]|uniref:acyl-[ACP]--phospholipid O-acyltransferase n=1 Tax=Sedimenticola hydrogenitrophicus TaxID=2967975 RepID=UPI0023B06615|nr:acyl-[ACP]--phospholipid O-acyltransferase [Sedimenticola hydrogenitrophicus]
MDKLTKLRGFTPFILIIFFNAFIDLGHKILIQDTIFKIYEGQTQIILTAVVNGLILLPFILLFTPAGFLSDKFRKPRVMQISAAVAVALTLLVTLSYYLGWFRFAFGLTFLLAVQSAFYSPAKYGYIKELTGKENLTSANAVVQAVTIVAILSGIFVFSVLFEQRLAGTRYSDSQQLLQAIAPIGWVLVACAVLELLLTLRLTPVQAEAPELQFDWQRYRSGHCLRDNVSKLRGSRAIWLSIVGLSVFWGISQVVLAAFPALAKASLGLDNTVVIQGIMACTGIGIIVGSLVAGKASKHYIETGLIPLGAAGVVIALSFIPQLRSTGLLIVDFLFLGVFGGLFIVPLNALIQFHARDEELGTVLAGNNWVQNLVMLGFLGLTVLFSIQGMGTQGLFHLLTLTALLGAIYTTYQLPQSLVRFVIARLFSSTHRIEVIGFKNLPAQGGVLLLGNHISWLDWAMVQIACPRPVRFVMERSIYQRWYIKWFLDLFGVVPIARGQSKEALETINALLRAGEVVCLFPEGAISRNGQLGEFKRGYERCVEGVEGVILPFYLRGLWGSRFSRSSKKLQELRNSGLRSNVIVAFGKPLPMTTPADALKQQVFELSIDSWEQYTQGLDSIPLAWMRSAKRMGAKTCLRDAQGGMPLTGHKVLTGVIGLSRLIRKRSPEQHIGLLLPASSAGVMTNLAALLRGKTVINLNYTASTEAMLAAVEKAEIRSLYTSSRFIRKLQQRGIDLEPLLSRVEVHHLEEMKEAITPAAKLLLMTASTLLPARLLFALFGKPVDIRQPAAILFSSGSEGDPKGVVLSHHNIMANIRQVTDVLDARHEDIVMSSLPLFHAFGLTVTGLMPMVEGIPAICHPDPTDVLTIAKAIARQRATIFCGTSTFLRLFIRNRHVHPLMLESLRVVVAGAERLNPEIRDAFKLKFNKEIYEGYGSTETTPVASVNIPDRLDPRGWQVQEGNRPGTVGLPLPGGSFRIVDPDTLQPLPAGEDGLILFGGTQVMLGYLKDAEKTAEVIVESEGKRWYKTGDKGHLDSDGFLTIVDRYSRFAKIGGEMISLGAIEGAIGSRLPEDTEILATAVPDEKKGEKVIVLFAGNITQDELKALINQTDLSPLMKPAQLVAVETIPKLGSGKSNFNKAREIALAAGVA